MLDTASATRRRTKPRAVAPTPVRRALGIALLVVIAAAVGLIVWSAPDFRGSDQHWHNENVRTLMRGAPAETHEVYPFSLIGPDRRFDDRRPFIHNAPVVYVWGAIARVLGDAHAAILAANIACALISAVLLYLAARRFMSRLGSLTAAALLLTVPVNFWITGQNMIEPLSATLVALALWIVVRNPLSLGAFVAAQAAIALAASGRIWTAPFLILVPLGLLIIDRERLLWQRAARALAALAAGIALYLPLSRVFAGYMPELDPMAVLEVARNNNMILFFTTEAPEPMNLSAFVQGVVDNLLLALGSHVAWTPQWYTISSAFPAADLMPISLLALFAASGLLACWKDPLRRFIVVLALGGFAAHLGMSTLYQALPRYAVPVLPALVLGATVAAEAWIRRIEAPPHGSPTRTGTGPARVGVAVLAGGALLAFTVMNSVNAHASRQSAFIAREKRAAATALIDSAIPSDSRVALDTPFGRRWAWDYALYPRPVLALGTDFPFEPEEYRRMADAFEPDYLVVSDDSSLPSIFDVRYVDGSDTVTVYEYVGRGDR